MSDTIFLPDVDVLSHTIKKNIVMLQVSQQNNTKCIYMFILFTDFLLIFGFQFLIPNSKKIPRV